MARRGQASGVFLTGYALSRLLVEIARQPDAHLGFVFDGVTMGQVLSLPMLLTGLAILAWSRRATTAKP